MLKEGEREDGVHWQNENTSDQMDTRSMFRESK